MDYFHRNKKVVFGFALLISLVIYMFLFRENSSESSWKTELSFLGAIDQGVAATGTINPKNTVEVGTQISGIIEGVFVDYNDTVQVGTLLAIVDSSIIDANIEQLEANLSAAEAVFKASESKYAREKRLHAQNFISISTLENTEKLFLESKSRLALAQAELKREKRNKTFTNITSPISGVVMEKKIDVGQTVAARFQTPTLFKIAADLNSMQIEALVSEADIGQVKRGQRVKFFVDAFFEELFEGTVELIRLEPKVEQGVVNYIVVIDVDNEDKKLLPGMTAQATIITSSKEGVQLVPLAAVRFKPPNNVSLEKKEQDGEKVSSADSATVYSPDNHGNLLEHQIETGISDGRFIEVIRGFEIGNEVITGEVNKTKEKSSAFRFSGR